MEQGFGEAPRNPASASGGSGFGSFSFGTGTGGGSPGSGGAGPGQSGSGGMRMVTPQAQGQGGDFRSGGGGRGGLDHAKTRSIGLSFGLNGLATTLRPDTTSEEFVISEVIPRHFADQPFMRNFITSSAETFARGRIEYHKSGPLSSEKLAQLSRSYRAVLLDLVQSLERSQDLDSASVYTHLDFVWHFCEIMFVSSHPDLPILPYLMSWVQQNFDVSPEILAELGPKLPTLIPESSMTTPFALTQDSINESLQKVWDIIFLYTFHGRTVDAMKLLPYTNTTRSKSYEEQIVHMQELMRKKPVYIPLSISVMEFESEWNAWRNECENRLNQKVFHGSDHLTLLVKVLSGDPDGFREAREYIKTWYEYLIMMLNYQYPTAKPPMLKLLTRKAIEDYGDGCIQLKPIEEVIVSAMDYDIVAVLKEILEHFMHPWFVLHFSDLIYCGGILPGLGETSIDYQSILFIRDDMLEEYGTSLMQHSSMWEVGIKYLAAVSGRRAWPMIAELLRRRKPATQYEAEKMIKIAEDFGFTEEVQGICKEVAAQSLRHGRLQQALLWSIRSSDVPLTTFIVDQILTDDDEILNISPILTVSLSKLYTCGERLLFLKGFSEFRNSLNQKQYEHAIVMLCQLIHDHLIPKRMASKVLAYLHEFAKIGFKFRPEEVSTLTEYIHTKVGRDSLEPEEFKKLNQVLIMNRAHCLLTAFREVKEKRETCQTEYENMIK